MNEADQAMVQEFRASLPLILEGKDPWYRQPRNYQKRIVRCSVGGCDRVHHARGLCDRHYWRTYSTPRRAAKRAAQRAAQKDTAQ